MLDIVRTLRIVDAMPDLDHLPRAASRHWRQPADAVLGRHEADVVAERMEKAMAATLRDGADRGRDQLRHLWLLKDALTVGAVERPAEVERVVSALPLTWVRGLGSCFVDAARLLARGVGCRDQDGDAVTFGAFVEAGLRQMARRLCTDPLAPHAIPDHFASQQEYLQYVRRCLDEVKFDELSASVVRCSNVSRLRAPSRRKQKTTVDLLHESI